MFTSRLSTLTFLQKNNNNKLHAEEVVKNNN